MRGVHDWRYTNAAIRTATVSAELGGSMVEAAL
jgi:hypothetical protein